MSQDLILHGDVGDALGELEDGSVAVAVTSPPYWRQRDYGFEVQIGQELSPQAYVGRLVSVFSRLRRKLRPDGVFFLNVGDKYQDRYGSSHLLGLPYRLAYHLRRDGWRLEDLLIWYKTNHLPSPVSDRFTNTYEPVLVLTRSPKNLYIGSDQAKVLRLPLEQIPWGHTAPFPEKLVRALLDRAALEDGDLVLDPFAGTGTTAVVVRRMRGWVFPVRSRCVMIEAAADFVDIMQERTGIGRVERPDPSPYRWGPVEDDFPLQDPAWVEPEGERGEVLLRSRESPSRLLTALDSEEFRGAHRPDALYFLGSDNWSLDDLYAFSLADRLGYVLRNILVVSEGAGGWHPVFMLARQSTRYDYRFDLDAVREEPSTGGDEDWGKLHFEGMEVTDPLLGREGTVAGVESAYPDGFPALCSVRWDSGKGTEEKAVHPDEEARIREGLHFACPSCGSELREPYDPVGENDCPSCGCELWVAGSVPEVSPPEGLPDEWEGGSAARRRRAEGDGGRGESGSKFAGMERVNWGQSPAARSAVEGESLTLKRLYEADQRMVYRRLTLAREAQGLSIADIRRRLPPEYEHKVGHWFRGDISGSIPVPPDSRRLRVILGLSGGLLELLEGTALFLQAVKNSPKGKNPGDFLEGFSRGELRAYLRRLYD